MGAAVRHASTSRLPDLHDRLDRAVGTVDLGVTRTPLWTRLVRGVQWLLLAAALIGGLWLAGTGRALLPAAGRTDHAGRAGLPVPTLLLVGGVVLGVLLALLCRVLVAQSARRRAQRADRRLRAAVTEVTDELVVAPARRRARRLPQDDRRVAQSPSGEQQLDPVRTSLERSTARSTRTLSTGCPAPVAEPAPRAHALLDSTTAGG